MEKVQMKLAYPHEISLATIKAIKQVNKTGGHLEYVIVEEQEDERQLKITAEDPFDFFRIGLEAAQHLLEKF